MTSAPVDLDENDTFHLGTYVAARRIFSTSSGRKSPFRSLDTMTKSVASKLVWLCLSALGTALRTSGPEFRRLFLVPALMVSWNGAVEGETLCKSNEVVYFSCKLAESPRIVSLCGSPLRDADNMPIGDFWLQYRFGRPERIELVYPKDGGGNPLPFSKAKFRIQYARHNQGFDIELSFTNHGFVYYVSSLEGAESEKDNSYGVTAVPLSNDPSVTPGVMRRCRDLPDGAGKFSALGRQYGQDD